jgi:hypothetical protein
MGKGPSKPLFSQSALEATERSGPQTRVDVTDTASVPQLHATLKSWLHNAERKIDNRVADTTALGRLTPPLRAGNR